jgi:hypothetical protein
MVTRGRRSLNQEEPIMDGLRYEVVERGRGWVLRRQDKTPLVEFPTRRQAVRAGLAVCLDEGLTGLVVRDAAGVEEVLDPVAGWSDTFEV